VAENVLLVQLENARGVMRRNERRGGSIWQILRGVVTWSSRLSGVSQALNIITGERDVVSLLCWKYSFKLDVLLLTWKQWASRGSYFAIKRRGNSLYIA
jgi:hypothetical protein